MTASDTIFTEKGERSAIHRVLPLIRNNIRQYSMLIALLAIMGFFQIVTDGTLMRPVNITNLVLQNSYIVIMAIGMLLVIVAGHIDLSVGSVAAFVGALAAVAMVTYGLPWPLVIVLGLVVGALVGAAQGFFVAYMGIPSFIVTLAGMLMFRGLTLALLQGQSIGPFPSAFQSLSSGFIPDLFGAEGLHITTLVLGALLSAGIVYLDFRSRQNRQRYGFSTLPFALFLLKNVVIVAAIMGFSYLMASYKGLPTVLIIMLLLIGLYSFLTTQTVIGRRIYALGGNAKASKLSGVNTERLAFFTFANLGLLAGLAGLIFAARLNVATPKAGQGFELDVIAAAFIGGASATGGVGTVVGAVIGALVMGVMNNGMSIVGIGIDWQQAIKGGVLLLAVIFDVYNKNKS